MPLRNLPQIVRVAFKEWAIVVDALGRGEQIFILRKGGIHEGRGGFRVEHDRFLLFPTLFHQQRESVIASAQTRFDQIAPDLPSSDFVRFEYWAQVIEWHELLSPSALDELRGQHIWRDELLRERFEWGRSHGIFAMVTRVHHLQQRVELPMLPSYGGCKSWIELDPSISTEGSVPVLSDSAFESKLERVRESLVQSAATR
jgi:hypothetical protein